MSEPRQYRKKPVVIEAMHYSGHNYDTAVSWMGDSCLGAKSPEGTLDIYIETLEGTMHVSEGDWIISGVRGEFYPCKPDIFDATYEEVTP